ncbi:MAG: aminoglycoside phosphotransferase family protein [Planctomycetota bacterium]
MAMHANEVTVSTTAVERLVAAQFPDWSGLDVQRIDSEGTRSAIFRLGTELAARFPLMRDEPDDVRAALEAEVRATREIGDHVSFPTPRPVALGEPGEDYPLPWAVQTWLPGVTATRDDPSDSVGFAEDLAQLIGELRAIDRRGRVFTGIGRGGPIPDHDDWMGTCFDESAELLDVPTLRAMWSRFRELPAHAGEVMCHGDLTPANVLVSDGRLAGVLDSGGLGAADPSLDLIPAWNLLDDAPRERFRSLLGCGDLEWERGRAWAFQQSMGLVWYYVESNPAMSRMGRRTLERLVRADA